MNGSTVIAPPDVTRKVPVGGRLGDCIGADRPVRSGTILDHDGLLERLGDAGRDGTRERVCDAAGWEIDDQLDRLVRPGLRGRVSAQRASCDQRDDAAPCC
jgi:hypothetical protein